MRLVTTVLAVEALGRELAVRLDVVTGKAIETLPYKVGRNRPMRLGDATPVPAALHQPEPLCVRLHRHARWVDDNGR
jgi:hypothetical protein